MAKEDSPATKIVELGQMITALKDDIAALREKGGGSCVVDCPACKAEEKFVLSVARSNGHCHGRCQECGRGWMQ